MRTEIDTTIGSEIARRLNRAAHKERGKIVKDYMQLFGWSRQTFYRIARKSGYRPKRKTRKDNGTRKVDVSDKQLQMIAGAMKKSKRKSRKITMPATVATEIMVDAGEMDKTLLNKMSTINRLLRQKGMSRKQMMDNWTTDDHQTPAFYTPLVCEHPNEYHCFDITPCTQYYFNTKGLRRRDENLQMYGGKLKYFKEVKNHLLRFVMVDHKTDVFFFKYFYTSGEKIVDLVEFFYQAWVSKEDKLYPFHGVPFNLYLDKGAANISHYIKNMCENLSINLEAHKAGNPRAKGKVETYMKLIQEQFESRLILNPAKNIDQLNERAYNWMVYYNATKVHTRTKAIRMALWSSLIKNEHLRVIPSKDRFLQAVKSKTCKAVISSKMTVKVDAKEYLVHGLVNSREKVLWDRDYFNLEGINLYKRNADGSKGEQLPTTLVRTNELGEPDYAIRLGKEWKRQEDTPTTIEMKAMDKIDYTAMSEAAFADKRDEIGNIGFMQKKGVPLIAEQVEIPPMSRHDAIREIRIRLKKDRVTTLERQRIEQLLPDGDVIREEDIQEVVEKMGGGQEHGDSPYSTTPLRYVRK